MIKTFAAMLLSGAVGAGSVITYTHYVPAPVVDLQPLFNRLANIERTDDATFNALLTTMSDQRTALLQIHQDMVQAAAERASERAKEQAAVDRYHGSLNHTIQSIPR